jgi:hypothetical protein
MMGLGRRELDDLLGGVEHRDGAVVEHSTVSPAG